MEIKTIPERLSAIDLAIVENVRLISIKCLEDIQNRLLEFRQSEYKENRIALLKVLKHINCIIDIFSSFEDDESIYIEYVEIIRWLVD